MRATLLVLLVFLLPWLAGCAVARPVATESAGRTYYDRGLEVMWTSGLEAPLVDGLPLGLVVQSGDLAMVRRGDRTFLASESGAIVELQLLKPLPDRFTIELEYRAAEATGPFVVSAAGRRDAPRLGSLGPVAFLDRPGEERITVTAKVDASGPTHIRFTAVGEVLDAYFNESMLDPFPPVAFPRTNRLRLEIPAGTDAGPTLVSVIFVATDIAALD